MADHPSDVAVEVLPSPLAELPFDLIMDVLRFLPVKSLIRFRCVCKHWKSVICSPIFNQLHFRTNSNNPSHLSLFTYLSNKPLLAMELNPQNHHNLNPTPLPTPPGVEILRYNVVGTCNGLLCFSGSYRTLNLYNPLTRYHLQLPPLQLKRKPYASFSFGLGYDSVSDDYKILALRSHLSEPGVVDDPMYIFSLKSFEWRKGPDFVPSCYILYPHSVSNFGLFAWGYLHWLVRGPVDCEMLILSFDIHNETYQFSSLPSEKVNGRSFISLYSHLCLVGSDLGFAHQFVEKHGQHVERSLDLWMMKEYGRQDSWIKVFRILYEDVGFSIVNGYVEVVDYNSDTPDYVLLTCDGLHYWYDLKRKASTPLTMEKGAKALKCVQSLVSISKTPIGRRRNKL